MTLKDIRNLLLTITPNTFHYDAGGRDVGLNSYIIWAEDGQNSTVSGDNKVILQEIQGTIDYYTKSEYDENFDKIQKALNDAEITWTLNSIQYETESKFIHYEWLFGIEKVVI